MFCVAKVFPQLIDSGIKDDSEHSFRVCLKELVQRLLVIFLIGLTFTGVLLVGSAEPALRNKQFFGMMLGAAIMLIVSLMDFSWILNFYWILYGCNIILLLSVWIFGTESNGASRWLRIGGFQFQPTELSKILIVMFFARFFMEHEENLNTLRTLVQTAILAAIP